MEEEGRNAAGGDAEKTPRHRGDAGFARPDGESEEARRVKLLSYGTVWIKQPLKYSVETAMSVSDNKFNVIS
jgi:hypothetical protein